MHGGLLLGPPGRLGRGAVRHRDRRARRRRLGRWLEWDPVRMAPQAAPTPFAGLRAVWIDSGRSDEFYLDLGAQAFHREVVADGRGEVHFELFDGKHGGSTGATRCRSAGSQTGSSPDGEADRDQPRRTRGGRPRRGARVVRALPRLRGPRNGSPGWRSSSMGDQFLAIAEGRRQPPDDDRHFGLVVDDKAAACAPRWKAAGDVDLPAGRTFRFVDPWGNQFEVVGYRGRAVHEDAVGAARAPSPSHLEKTTRRRPRSASAASTASALTCSAGSPRR